MTYFPILMFSTLRRRNPAGFLSSKNPKSEYRNPKQIQIFKFLETFFISNI